MIGLVLALLVIGVVVSFVGLWQVGIVVGVVALVLLVLFVFGIGRRPAKTES